jgi:hypothetical protein
MDSSVSPCSTGTMVAYCATTSLLECSCRDDCDDGDTKQQVLVGRCAKNATQEEEVLLLAVKVDDSNDNKDTNNVSRLTEVEQVLLLEQ